MSIETKWSNGPRKIQSGRFGNVMPPAENPHPLQSKQVAKVSVYPVEEVFLAEIRGKDDRLYAVDATKYFASS